MRPDPPPGYRWTGRQTEVVLIDPPCPAHGVERFRRSWAPCRNPNHGPGPSGHCQWIYACDVRLHLVGGAYVEGPDCI